MKKLIGITLMLMCLPNVVFGQTSLDLSSDNVPKKFNGDDVVRVIKSINKVSSVKVRGSYQIYYGPFDKNVTDKMYLFKLSDKKVFVTPSVVIIEPFVGEDYYLVKDMGEKERHYIGQNVFGAKKEVWDFTDTKYFINPINISIPSKFKVDLPVTAKVGVLFICKPGKVDKAYVTYPGKSYAATFESPIAQHNKYYSLGVRLYEIWFYDKASGKIYLKYKANSSHR
jgi:hypothetical protein